MTNPLEQGAPPTFSSYAPQWNPEVGGKHVSYRVEIDTQTNNVDVSFVETKNNASTYNELELGEHDNDKVGIFVESPTNN